MIWIVAAIFAAVLSLATGANVLLVGIGIGMIVGALSVAIRPVSDDAGTPVAATRLPTHYEQAHRRRWGWAFGLTFIGGIVPFITVYRRPRWPY